jgi:hypothetical protein
MWTIKYPTKAGFYWWRAGEFDGSPDVHLVTDQSLQRGECYEGEQSYKFDDLHGQWQPVAPWVDGEPIKEPLANEK